MDRNVSATRSDQEHDYYRVRVDIPVRITAIEEADLAERSAAVLSHVDRSFPDIEPALIAWLDRIERKLDHLISLQRPVNEREIGPEDRQPLDLSAKGFLIAPKEHFSIGTAVYVEFELPSVPILLVRCIGRVEATHPTSSEAERDQTEIVFETIRQSDLDAVVRFTLSVQRQAIRGRATSTSRSK